MKITIQPLALPPSILKTLQSLQAATFRISGNTSNVNNKIKVLQYNMDILTLLLPYYDSDCRKRAISTMQNLSAQVQTLKAEKVLSKNDN